MKKLAKLLAVVIAVLMTLSCIPMAALSAHALEADVSGVVINDATDSSKYLTYELMGTATTTGIGHTPTGTYYQAQYWTPHTWSTWSGMLLDIDSEAVKGAKAIALWVDFSEYTDSSNNYRFSIGNVSDKSADTNGDGKVNYKDRNAQIAASAIDFLAPTNESKDYYLVSYTGELIAKNFQIDGGGTSLGAALGGFKGWVIVPTRGDTSAVEGANTLLISRNGHMATKEVDGGKTFRLDEVTAVYDVEAFVAEKQAELLDDSVLAVLNDGTDATVVSKNQLHTPTAVTYPGLGADGTAISMTYNGGSSSQAGWNEWANVHFPISVPEGADVSNATAVALWVDFTNLKGTEPYRIDKIYNTADSTVIYQTDINTSTSILVSADGSTVTEAKTGYGRALAGFKGWYIVPLSEGADLTTVNAIGIHRNGYLSVNGENYAKKAYFDNFVAVEDVNAFVLSYAGKAQTQKDADLDVKLLNDFSDLTTVDSTYDLSSNTVLHSLDGMGYKFNTTRGKNIVMNFDETDLSEYEAIALHIVNPSDVTWSFTDFQNAAGTKITAANKNAITSGFFLVNDDGTVTEASLTANEAGFWNIQPGTSAYVLVKFKAGLAEGDLVTNAIKFVGTQWHHSSAANAGRTFYIDNLIAVKDMDAFARSFNLNKLGTKASYTVATAPTYEYTSDTKDAIKVTFDATENAASYDVVVYTNGSTATYNTTETTYTFAASMYKEYMVQVVAKDAYGKTLAVYKDANIAPANTLFVPVNTLEDKNTATGVNAIIGAKETIGGNGILAQLWGWSGVQIDNLIDLDYYTGARGLLFYLDMSNFTGNNYFSIAGVVVDPVTGEKTSYPFIGDTVKTTNINTINAKTGEYTTVNEWGSNGFPATAGEACYYLIELHQTDRRFEEGFDFAQFDYFTIQRKGNVAMSEEDIAKIAYIDSFYYVNDVAAFKADVRGSLAQIGAYINFDAEETRPLLTQENGVLTVKPTEFSVATDSVVVNLYNANAQLIATADVVEGVAQFTGVAVGTNYAVQAVGYNAGAVVYEGRPMSFTAKDGCYHVYDAGVVTEPTCETEGYTTYTCTACGEQYNGDKVAALGHTYDAGVVTAPTCTAAGYTTYTCACGHSYTADEVAALGHNYQSEITLPTCDTDGYTTYTCSVCGDTYVDDIIAAVGHNYNKVVTAPTCTTEGYTTYTCVCGDTYVADKVAALGHNYEAAVTAPDCVNGGYTTYTCTVCGDTYIADETDALGHNYNAVVTAPTCTTEGYTTYTCSVCGDSYVADTVAALGHTEEILPAVAPTLNATGLTEGKKCSVCGEILVAQEVVDKLPGGASINGYNYASLQEAIAAANDGDTVVMTSDASADAIITIDKAITLDGNEFTLTSTAGRAINVETNGDVVIKNLTIDAKGERAINIINKTVNVTVDNVTATAKNYGIMVATSAQNVVLTVNDSDFTGLAVINIAGPNAQVEINNTNITCVDNNANENYGAITVYSTATDADIVVNGGKVVVSDDSVASAVFPADATVTFNETEGADKIDYVVAMVGNGGFTTLQEAVEYAKDGQTIDLVRDVTLSEILVIDKAITLDGNNCTLTSTAGRAINVAANGAVTIKDLTVVASGERAINVITYPAVLTLDNVNATAANYAINVAGSGAGADITVNGGEYTGLAVINVAAENVNIEINNAVINCVDNNANESYGAITISSTAADADVVVNGGKVVVSDDSAAAAVFPADATITFNETEGADKIDYIVAMIGLAGFTSLEKAVEYAKDGQTIDLVRDVTLTETLNIGKNITIDLNGNTINSAFNTTYAAIYVKLAGNLTIKGEGEIVNTEGIAIGVYGKLTVNDATVNGAEASIYNYYYNASMFGTTTINSGNVEGWVWNSGILTVNDGAIENLDTSGALTVNGGEIGYLYAKDGTDAAGVVGAGTITIADPTAINVPEDYKVVEAGDGVYKVVAKEYVAEVNGTQYESLQEAVDAAVAGDTVTLVADVAVDASVIISTDITLDLAGHTVMATGNLKNAPVLRIKAAVTVTGGTVDGTTGINSYAIIVGQGSTAGALTIADGTYKGITSVISITLGTADISGGDFMTAHDGEGEDYGSKYLLNCMDAAYNNGTAVYTVTGGNFYGFNPYNNAAEGAATNFVADGLHATDLDEDGIFTLDAHNYDAVVTAPTCTENGYTTYTCVCGDTYIADETDALGHSYDAVVTAPDCVNGGYTTYTCTVCGDTYTADETDALGHNYEAVVTAPDCVNGGYTTYTCTVCGDTYTADETDALGHNYESEIVPATPDAQGYTKHTCTVCGDTYNDNFVDYVPEEPSEAPVEDFEYTVVGDTVTITKYIGNAEVVIIPSEIEGKPVTIIGQKAFYSNRTITSVTVPGTVTTICKEAFRGCTALTEANFNEGLQIISTNSFVGTKLVKVVCPDTLTTIGVSAFNGVTTLTDIDLANVKTIKGTAFAGCTALGTGNATNYIAIPETLTDLGAGAFQNCTAIARIDWYATAIADGAAGNNETPAFMGCTGIKTVNIMDTAERLPSFMFYKAADPANRLGITALTFKGTSKVVSIGDRAFYQARMGKIILPASLKSVGKETFRNINLLTQLDLGTGLETIGMNAFSNCNNLASVTIPGNVKTVLANAFRDCAALETAVFEEGVEVISSYVFKGTALKSLTLANSITQINAGICHLCEEATIYYYAGSYAESYLNSYSAKLTGQTLSSLGVYGE